MSSCRIEKKLPSCDVDIKLLTLMQSIYNNVCKQYLNIEIKDDESKDLSIRIIDDFGNESFTSVERIPYESFPDGVNRIDISINVISSSLRSHLQVETSFSNDRFFSRIQIYYSGENARSIVVAIYDKILYTISTKKNNNNLYNPTNLVGSVIMAGSWSPLWLAFPIYRLGLKYFILGIFTMFLIWGYLYYGKRLKPYCSFDSPSANRRAKLADWLVMSAIGFILFGTLLSLGRKMFLGF